MPDMMETDEGKKILPEYVLEIKKNFLFNIEYCRYKLVILIEIVIIIIKIIIIEIIITTTTMIYHTYIYHEIN